MTKPSLREYMQAKKKTFDRLLMNGLSDVPIPDKLKQSMIYSLAAGGKRLRPILLFATLEALESDEQKGISTAIALEMIHTYSLIHDDLPSMDDDDLRRGKPTNHKVFGEATAVLAGDGLLTMAFQVLLGDQAIGEATRVRLAAMLARAAGPEGMVGGQQLDLEGEDRVLTLDQLMAIHRLKTGRLIRFPVEAAAVIGHASSEQYEALTDYADHLGLAFQIGDDILDQTGNEKELGKPIGSDEGNHKNTYVSLLSLERAKEEMSRHVEAAASCLSKIGQESGRLMEIARYLLKRTS